MWFYEKEEIRYSPTSSSEILFSLGVSDYLTKTSLKCQVSIINNHKSSDFHKSSGIHRSSSQSMQEKAASGRRLSITAKIQGKSRFS